MKLRISSLVHKGGPGSGNFGHAGRPGEVGGSSSGYYNLTAGHPPISDAYKFTPHDEILNDGIFGEWRHATIPTRQEVKSDVVKQLHEFGVSEGDARRMLHGWATSSNDNNKISLSLQEAISEEFDVPLSDFQKTHIDRVKSEYGKNSFNKGVDRLGDNIDDRKHIARAVYANTQQYLQALGYSPDDEITVYRGIETDKSIHNFQHKDHVNWQGNAVESWSLGIDVAQDFGRRTGRYGSIGYVVSMSVKVSSIWATAKSGPGCLNEGEIIIFGSIHGNTAQVEFVHD